jgi:NMD protein affecting ribosome stability and mRNA decay
LKEKIMKCFACGYEKRNCGKWIDEAILYKTGKKKGQVKEVVKIFYDPDEHRPKFLRLYIQGNLETNVENDPFTTYRTERPVDLYVCPECGTVRIGD